MIVIQFRKSTINPLLIDIPDTLLEKYILPNDTPITQYSFSFNILKLKNYTSATPKKCDVIQFLHTRH